LKQYKVPFEYNEVDFLDLRSNHRVLYKKDDSYREWYEDHHAVFLNGKKYYAVNEQRFKANYNKTKYDFFKTEDRHKGQTLYLLAPGPSLSGIDKSKLEGKTTMALNSAGYWTTPTYWAMIESRYIRRLYSKNRCKREKEDKITFLVAPRSAVTLWDQHVVLKKMYIMCLEECGMVPFPVEGPTIWNTLAAAWFMGFSNVVLLGLDLGGKSQKLVQYMKGVPFDGVETGKKPYSHQHQSLKYAIYPGMTIYNVNPYSNEFGLPFTPLSEKDAYDF